MFGKCEGMFFADDGALPGDESDRNVLWYGGGLEYHLIDNLTSVTLAYQRMELPGAPMPDGVRTGANQFTLAAQVLYD